MDLLVNPKVYLMSYHRWFR